MNLKLFDMNVRRFTPLIFIILLVINLSSCGSNIELLDPWISFALKEDINIDGNFSDWKNVPEGKLISDEFGNIPDPSDLKAVYKAAWKENELFLYFQIEDDKIFWKAGNPWKSDVIQLFFSPYRGSEDIFHIIIPLNFEDRDSTVFILNDYRKSPELRKYRPEFQIQAVNDGQVSRLEMKLDLSMLGTGKNMTKSFGMQFYIDDYDRPDGKNKNRLILYNSNYSAETSFTHQQVRLDSFSTVLPEIFSRVSIKDDEEIKLKLIGSIPEGKLEIFKGNKSIEKIETTVSEFDTTIVYDLSKYGIQTEEDSLYVVLNGECIGFHNLIIAPREYENIKPKSFIQSIRLFKLLDRYRFPGDNATLFIGSSTIRRWYRIYEDFPEIEVIHRGFGGSTSEDALMYIDDIVLPYLPGTIIYYEGDNDIPRKFPEDTIYNNIEKFIQRVKAKREDTRIFLVSPKPSIARMNYWPQYQTIQKGIKEISQNYENVFYIDVSEPMFKDGKLRDDIFVEDNIHLTDTGYDIWKNAIRAAIGLEANELAL